MHVWGLGTRLNAERGLRTPSLVDNPFSTEFSFSSADDSALVGMDTFMFDESSKEKSAVPDSVLQNLLLKVSSSC